MNMVSHQAIRPNFQLVFLAGSPENSNIKPAILVIEKYRRAVVAALRDMMGIIYRNCTRYPWHTHCFSFI